MKYDESYIGRKNNMLTVLGYTRVSDGRKWFICRCDCGNIKIVKPTRWTDNKVKSCGCLARSLRLEHTQELDRIRRIYNGMIQRCYNPHSQGYKYYGARGIVVCDEWINDRESFVKWSLSHGYANDLTIDRINNDGNYEPGNCRWATYSEQARNQRRPKVLPPRKNRKTWTIDGITKSCLEWCEEFGVSYNAAMYRITRRNMSVKEALTSEKATMGRPRKIV